MSTTITGKFLVCKIISYGYDVYLVDRNENKIYQFEQMDEPPRNNKYIDTWRDPQYTSFNAEWLKGKKKDMTNKIKRIYEQDCCKGLEGRVSRHLWTAATSKEGDKINWIDIIEQYNEI